MKVKCFDENTEKDLEGKINAFLKSSQTVDVKLFEIIKLSISWKR